MVALLRLSFLPGSKITSKITKITGFLLSQSLQLLECDSTLLADNLIFIIEISHQIRQV